MKTVVETQELRNALNALIGKPLWDAVASEITGTNVLFEFGRKFRAKDVYEKPTVSQEDMFLGEVGLMVWCSWRIEIEETRLLCGCGDLHNEGGPLFTGLQKLVGDTVVGVSLGSFLDLLIVFSSGRRLRLFCDRREDGRDWAHYLLTIICEHERALYAAVNDVVTCERLPRVGGRIDEKK